MTKFMIQHQKSTTYYLQRNRQAESINKVFKDVLIKILRKNQIDWNIKFYLV